MFLLNIFNDKRILTDLKKEVVINSTVFYCANYAIVPIFRDRVSMILLLVAVVPFEFAENILRVIFSNSGMKAIVLYCTYLPLTDCNKS